VRAFAGSARVSHRGCSRPLQRAVTDFGADQSFAQVMDKLVERKRYANHGVAYEASVGIFFTAHGSRLSMSSTVFACGKTVNTLRR
jgi:hypothetical protein